jgi:tetratricopeptide (TPR) repeat protein
MKPTLLRLSIILAGALLFAGCAEKKRLTSSSPDALRYYDEGVSFFEKFYYREAWEAIDRSLDADSAFAMAWARRAMLSWDVRDENGAKVEIDRAMKLSTEASRREQLFIRMWYNRIHYLNKEAGATADSLFARYPDEREALVFRGNMYEMDKNYEAAIRSYMKALDVDSTYAPAVMHLGYAYSSQGDQQKALASMQRYIRLVPEAADPRASYADLLLRSGRYDDALEQYRKSLELKSDYSYSVRRIGEIYALQGRLREAEEQFHKALALLPKREKMEVAHLIADGRLDFLRGKYGSALKQFQKAIQLDTTMWEAASGVALSLAKLGKFDEANEVVDRLKVELERRNLAEAPLMAGYHLIRGRVLTEQGLYDEALAACEHSVQLASPFERGSAYQQTAEILLRQKEYERALDACEEALGVLPNNPIVLLTLLKTYRAKGDARMTAEIGNRLLMFWDHADPDFQYLLEARRAVGRQASPAAQ